MKTNGESKFSYLLIGLGLGAIGALMFALSRARRRGNCRWERTSKTLDYLNQKGRNFGRPPK